MQDQSKQLQARQQMIRQQLEDRGISDPRVLQAFARVPRDAFVWEVDRHQAYADQPLRIACGQTISQPYMVALMTQELDVKPSHRVLEIGTGSGYQTAILAELADKVFTIDRHEDLVATAQDRLEKLGYDNVVFSVDDGTLGWPEEAPFDRIIVTAAAPHVPAPLRGQLADGGRLAVPVGDEQLQRLKRIDRHGTRFSERAGPECRFVPLIGKEGW